MRSSWDVAREGLLQQMLTCVKLNKLEILTPTGTNGIPLEMDQIDFKATILDFPMTINPDQLQSLITHYVKRNRKIDYKRFVDDLVHADGGEASSPPPSPLRPSVNPKIVKLARELRDASVTLPALVESFDRNHTGKVLLENFCRALSHFPSARDVARIVVNLKTREIDYRKLQAALDAVCLSTPKPEGLSVPTDGIPDAVVAFANKVRARGIILEDVFDREQKTKSGLMNPQMFLRVVKSFGVKMADAEFEPILEYFANAGQIDCPRFVRVMEHCLDQSLIEPRPPQVDAQACKKTLIENFAKRRLNIWKIFKPHDRLGDGKVAKNQFVQTCIRLQLDLTEAELQAVADSLAVDDGTMISYVDFARIVYGHKGVNFDETIDALLTKLRDFLMERSERLSRALSIYDRDNSGLISTPQFINALRKLGFSMTDRELALFRAHYEDSKTRHFLHWREICEHIDIHSDEPLPEPPSVIFTPSMRDVTTSSERAMHICSEAEFPAGNPREARPIPEHLIPLYGRIYHALVQFGFDLREELLRMDKLKRGTVPQTAFRQIMTLLPVRLTPQEIDQLLDFYKDQNTGSIYYLSFDKDIEEFGNQHHAVADTRPEPEEAPAKPPEAEEDRSAADPILRRVKQYLHQTRSTLTEYFRDFDRWKNGTVPLPKFATALAKTGLVFSKSEIETLSKFFTDSRKPEFMNYSAFCQAVANVQEDVSGFGNVPMTTREEDDAGAIVRRWTDSLNRKRWTFRRLFGGAAPGLMAPDLFREKIIAAGLFIRTDEWQLILKKYRGNPAGDVDWARFVGDSEVRSPF